MSSEREMRAKIVTKSDTKEIDKTIDKYEELGAKATSTQKTLKSFGSSLKSTVSQFLALAKTIDSLTRYTDDFIASQNVLNQTFGASTSEINDYAKNLSEMTGIANVDIARKSALFGQMAKSLGMTNDVAKDFVIQLDDMSAKLALLYNQDFNTMAKALLDAVKGESSTLASLTGNVLKTGGLQATLDDLGINAQASALTGANRAMLEYITIARQLNVTNEQMGSIVNDVAWQKRLLKSQVKELAEAFGNLLYPILKSILPVINGVLIALRYIINAIAGLLGFTGKASTGVSEVAEGFNDLAGGITATDKAIKKLRGFDKLNNLMTSVPSGGLGGLGGVNKTLLNEMAKVNQEMLNIRNKAQEIAESIMKWLGFIQDANGEWKFSHVTLGTILGALVGGSGIIWAISKIFGLFRALKGFGGLGTLLGFGTNVGSASGGLSISNPATILKGIADLTLILAGLTGLVVAYGALTKVSGFSELITKGISQLVSLFTGLSKIMIPLGAYSAMIAVLGMAGFATVASGTAGFVTAIAGLTALVVGLGALTKVKGFSELVSGGMDVLVDLAYGIGKFAGALVSGLGTGLTKGLPDIGSNLAGFMTNAKPFFDGLPNINESNANAVYNLSKMILSLTAADVLEGLTKWFTGGNSLTKFGKELSEFAPYFKEYAENIKGLDNSVVDKSAKSALAIAEFARKLPNSGGLKDLITGKNDLSSFGKMLPDFGKNLKKYADNVKGLDTNIVETSTKSASTISTFAKNLPNSGGLKDLITGKNDLSEFGKMLPSFGKNLKAYSENIKDLDGEVVSNSAKSAKAISELAKNLPNQGGLASLFSGDNKLSSFGEELAKFGSSFKKYSTTISSLDINSINNFTNAISKLVDLSVKIKDKGIKSTIKEFAEKLKDGGNAFTSFFSTTNAYSIGVDFGASLGRGIAKSLKSTKYPTIKLQTSSGSNVDSFTIKAYQNGGFVDSGQMFLARENGLSEMVGQIGHKTAVANNDQIVSAIASGVARANMATKGNQKVVIEAQGDSSGLLDFITFKQKERDRQYGL